MPKRVVFLLFVFVSLIAMEEDPFNTPNKGNDDDYLAYLNMRNIDNRFGTHQQTPTQTSANKHSKAEERGSAEILLENTDNSLIVRKEIDLIIKALSLWQPVIMENTTNLTAFRQYAENQRELLTRIIQKLADLDVALQSNSTEMKQLKEKLATAEYNISLQAKIISQQNSKKN